MTPRSRASGTMAAVALLGLCAVGLANGLHPLACHRRLIDRMWRPLGGDGCATAARAPEARHLGAPNAAVGAAGYIAIAALSSATVPSAKVRSYPLAATALAAWVASALLLWEQAAKVRVWCFWCLAGAGINTALLPLALLRGHRMARQ